MYRNNRNPNVNPNISGSSQLTNTDHDDQEVTEGALQIWRNLPEKIRQDPSLASFQQENQRLHLNSGDEDPLPSGSSNHQTDDQHHLNIPTNILNSNTNNNNSGGGGIRIIIHSSINDLTTNTQPGNHIDGDDNDNKGNLEGQHNDDYHRTNQLNNHGENNEITDPSNKMSGGVGTNTETENTNDNKSRRKIFKIIKVLILLMTWSTFTGFLMFNNEIVNEPKQLSIASELPKDYYLNGIPPNPRIGLILNGAFDNTIGNNFGKYLYVYIQLLHIRQIVTNNNNSNSNETDASQLSSSVEGSGDTDEHEVTHTENITTIWKIPITDPNIIDKYSVVKRSMVFEFGELELNKLYQNSAKLRIRLRTNLDNDQQLPIQMIVNETPINKTTGVLYAAIVLLGLYIMIIWEIVHRTFAAMIASTMAIGILAALNERPTMAQIISWIDIETLLLLFGMMILVAILSETGFFDYLAVYAYKITNGQIWPLINCLCFFTAIMSSFLDNVTTVLLMTPVSIRLCEVMGLNPVPILMSMIIYSNIGGALTPVGDPPNVIIASNSIIAKKGGVTFTIFTMHMALGVLMVMIQTYFQLRYKFRNTNDLRFSEPQDVQEMRHEITVWQRAAASLSSYSKDEDLVRETLMKKVNRLKRTLKKKQTTNSVPIDNYEQTLEQLQAKYPIRSKSLLIKSGFALIFVISLFFLHSVPELQRLSLGWTALLGAMLLLILADKEDMEAILARVEWSTLLFFAALFVLMESLSELGLIDWIGKQTELIILSVDKESRLAVAVLLILWVSAIASAFVDNIPLTTMMVKITISLAENEELGLPMQPLIWALAFGACLGGNGTLIGASANVVCAGVAEQHGYRFTFIQYFKIGFPIMIGSIIVATFYLMMVHVVFQWH